MARAQQEGIFSPFRIGRLELRNRVVAPPMVQLRPITTAEGGATMEDSLRLAERLVEAA